MPVCLETALQKLYGDQGLKSQYRRFDSIAQLKDAGLTLAVVKSDFMTDHCVAILEVSDDEVIVADPAWGKKALSYKEFEEIWRFSGIVLKRDSAQDRIS